MDKARGHERCKEPWVRARIARCLPTKKRTWGGNTERERWLDAQHPAHFFLGIGATGGGGVWMPCTPIEDRIVPDRMDNGKKRHESTVILELAQPHGGVKPRYHAIPWFNACPPYPNTPILLGKARHPAGHSFGHFPCNTAVPSARDSHLHDATSSPSPFPLRRRPTGGFASPFSPACP